MQSPPLTTSDSGRSTPLPGELWLLSLLYLMLTRPSLFPLMALIGGPGSRTSKVLKSEGAK